MLRKLLTTFFISPYLYRESAFLSSRALGSVTNKKSNKIQNTQSKSKQKKNVTINGEKLLRAHKSTKLTLTSNYLSLRRKHAILKLTLKKYTTFKNCFKLSNIFRK